MQFIPIVFSHCAALSPSLSIEGSQQSMGILLKPGYKCIIICGDLINIETIKFICYELKFGTDISTNSTEINAFEKIFQEGVNYTFVLQAAFYGDQSKQRELVFAKKLYFSVSTYCKTCAKITKKIFYVTENGRGGVRSGIHLDKKNVCPV